MDVLARVTKIFRIFLERFLCSIDGGGPADGDEGLIVVKSSSDISSSDSGVTIG